MVLIESCLLPLWLLGLSIDIDEVDIPGLGAALEVGNARGDVCMLC